MYTLVRNPKGLFISMTLLVLGMLFSGSVYAQKVIYVDQISTGNQDGSTWVDAFNQFEDALTAASSGDEIWVAQGIYLPGDTIQSRFVVAQDIRIYGGFAGAESQLDERDPVQYPTILSGDVLGDDFPSNTQNNRWDNLYTILEIKASVTSATRIDGFIFRGGHARGDNFFATNAWGGAIFCEGAPQIHGCVFEDNYADKRGGAIYIQSDHANGMLIQDCQFYGNRSNEDGGAVFVNQTDGSGVFMNDNTFELNQSDRRGGAICVYNANTHLQRDTFSNNQSRRTGGAVHVQASYNLLDNTIDSCSFLLNSATRGGALYLVSSSVFGSVLNNFSVSRSNFVLNEAMDMTNNPSDAIHGGAIVLESNVNASETSASIQECTFSENGSEGEAGVLHVQFDGQESSLSFVRNILNNNTSQGDGPINISVTKLGEAELLLDSCTWMQNIVSGGSSGLILEASGSGIVQLRINQSSILSGEASEVCGMSLRCNGLAKVDVQINDLIMNNNAGERNLHFQDDNGQMVITCQNSTWSGNMATGSAGWHLQGSGMAEMEEASFRFENVLIQAQQGQGSVIQVQGVNVGIFNTTLAQNEVPGLIIGIDGIVQLQNCILATNAKNELANIVGNGSILSHGGNIIDDASFVDWMGPSDLQNTDPLFLGTADFGLTSASPGIDFGTLPDSIYPFDLAGNVRIQGNRIDAGAFESPFTSSVIGSHTPIASLEIWPNPATDAVFISLKDGLSSHADIRMFNAAGRLVKEIPGEMKMGFEEVAVSLSGMATGVYNVQLFTSSGIQAMGSFVVVPGH